MEGGLLLPGAQKRVQEAEAVGERRESTFSPIAGDTACAEAEWRWSTGTGRVVCALGCRGCQWTGWNRGVRNVSTLEMVQRGWRTRMSDGRTYGVLIASSQKHTAISAGGGRGWTQLALSSVCSPATWTQARVMSGFLYGCSHLPPGLGAGSREEMTCRACQASGQPKG